MTGAVPLKDERLARLAVTANVAQFVSFGPGGRPEPRFNRLHGHAADADLGDLESSVRELLRTSQDRSVNVRTYLADQQKSSDFHYGITSADDAATLVRRHATDGRYTIVNETIDVEDGGVSGVVLGDVIEFAPDDTPRCVEKPGTAAFDRTLGLRLLQTVYGFKPDLQYGPAERIEWSIHPRPTGVRQTHTLIWETEHVGEVDLAVSPSWPNRFSRHVGDKAYGLLVADLLGFPVPDTTIVSRRVAPFRFGRPTGSHEVWMRTCPAVQLPGKLPTTRGWSDPFALATELDPDGTRLASIAAQAQVDATFSGATMPLEDGSHVVEGVQGWGEAFMVGDQLPEPVPETVRADVERLADDAERALRSPVRLEWAHDGERVWVLQLHVTHAQVGGTTIYPGDADRWHPFDPADGLEALRVLIESVSGSYDGIVITGPIGVTSHFGDVLRRGRVPSRIDVERADHPS